MVWGWLLRLSLYQSRKRDYITSLDCCLVRLFYAKDENAMVHLGIKKDKSLGYYIPKTFFVEKIGTDGVDSYIDKQKEITVTKRNRIIML